MKRYNVTQKIVFITLLSILLSCNNGEIKNAENVPVENLPEDIVELRGDQIRLAGIETGKIEIRSLGNTFKVNGLVVVAPRSLATVCAPMGGFILSTSLLPGNFVREGEILAVMENQEFVDLQQNYFEAKNKLLFAEAEYKRHSDLFKDDVYSEQNLQQVTTEYKNLKAQVKALEQKLTLIGINPDNLDEDDISLTANLVSPISGFVKTVNANIGKFVTSADVVFEIINTDKLYLELTLFEKDAGRVVTGQKIRFFINNEAEQHDAIIHQTGKSVNADKTFNVYATVTGTCKNIWPGMYVNAIIEEDGKNVTALPSDAIVSFDDKEYIFVFYREKEEAGNPFTEYRMLEVHSGVTNAGYTEIVLPADFDFATAKVVLKGSYNLLSAKKNSGEMAC